MTHARWRSSCRASARAAVSPRPTHVAPKRPPRTKRPERIPAKPKPKANPKPKAQTPVAIAPVFPLPGSKRGAGDPLASLLVVTGLALAIAFFSLATLPRRRVHWRPAAVLVPAVAGEGHQQGLGRRGILPQCLGNPEAVQTTGQADVAQDDFR